MDTVTIATETDTRTATVADIIATLPTIPAVRIVAASGIFQPYQFCVTLANGWTFSFNADTPHTRILLSDAVMSIVNNA